MKRSTLLGTRISAFSVRPSVGAEQLQRQREAEIRDERERMRRIDGERRQHREDVVEEVVLQPGLLALGDLAGRRRARCRPRASCSRSSRQRRCWSAASTVRPRRCGRAARRASARPATAGVRPERTCPRRPATRTMKNSSRLLAEIERKRSCSSSGWLRFDASSNTRRLKCSQDSSRLKKRSGGRAQRRAHPGLPQDGLTAAIAARRARSSSAPFRL